MESIETLTYQLIETISLNKNLKGLNTTGHWVFTLIGEGGGISRFVLHNKSNLLHPLCL